jgi:predicted Zn-dependent protease
VYGYSKIDGSATYGSYDEVYMRADWMTGHPNYRGNSDNLGNVLVHEVGHFLGLLHNI